MTQKLTTELQEKLDKIGILEEVIFIRDNWEKIENPEEKILELIKSQAYSTASLRAPKGYHLPNIMSQKPELFLKFGGHPAAAGFSIDNNNLLKVQEYFEETLKQITPEIEKNNIFFSEEIGENERTQLTEIPFPANAIILNSLLEINKELIQSVFQNEPYGIDYPEPLFYVKINTKDDILAYKIIGKELTHIKINLKNGKALTVFNFQEKGLEMGYLTTETTLWVGFRIAQNYFNNRIAFDLIAENILNPLA
jgi:single-stranded DNA-specific DHH superfamily exonuclease